MGFTDEDGYPLINDEKKIRITLSRKAQITISEDMTAFGIQKTATFINKVFSNYKDDAESSISLYMQQREIELDRLFTNSGLHNEDKKEAINVLLADEKAKIMKKISAYCSAKGESRLYHINDANFEYLTEDCDEDKYFNRPGQYIRSVIEEYCSLPFIKRERICRKDIYDKVQLACEKKNILKIKAPYCGKDQIFYVYPYKIMPDPFHTQSYLVCYSRKAEDEENDKIIASFSMARINTPTVLNQTFHLNKQEISDVEAKISEYSAAYLVGMPELIMIKLTDKGKQLYKSKLFSRPEKIEEKSTKDVYAFDCTQLQIFNYFFSFGADAEIISPKDLRDRFKDTYDKAFKLYSR